eukprot:8672689-Karenia_brevis.AAC.1
MLSKAEAKTALKLLQMSPKGSVNEVLVRLTDRMKSDPPSIHLQAEILEKIAVQRVSKGIHPGQ